MPVVEEDGRLVGVLSRAVVQRRLAEDETLDEPASPASSREPCATVHPNPHPPTGNKDACECRRLNSVL